MRKPHTSHSKYRKIKVKTEVVIKPSTSSGMRNPKKAEEMVYVTAKLDSTSEKEVEKIILVAKKKKKKKDGIPNSPIFAPGKYRIYGRDLPVFEDSNI